MAGQLVVLCPYPLPDLPDTSSGHTHSPIFIPAGLFTTPLEALAIAYLHFNSPGPFPNRRNIWDQNCPGFPVTAAHQTKGRRRDCIEYYPPSHEPPDSGGRFPRSASWNNVEFPFSGSAIRCSRKCFLLISWPFLALVRLR